MAALFRSHHSLLSDIAELYHEELGKGNNPFSTMRIEQFKRLRPEPRSLPASVYTSLQIKCCRSGLKLLALQWSARQVDRSRVMMVSPTSAAAPVHSIKSALYSIQTRSAQHKPTQQVHSPNRYQVGVLPAVHEEGEQEQRQKDHGLNNVDHSEAAVQAQVCQRVLHAMAEVKMQ